MASNSPVRKQALLKDKETASTLGKAWRYLICLPVGGPQEACDSPHPFLLPGFEPAALGRKSSDFIRGSPASLFSSKYKRSFFSGDCVSPPSDSFPFFFKCAITSPDPVLISLKADLPQASTQSSYLGVVITASSH